MPAIARIRLVNLVYENGAKQYRDEIFQFDGHNGVILLENGGGKTVFVQAVLQAVLPHAPLAERKARDTFHVENNPLHLAVEWIVNEKPRRYALTAVTLFSGREGLDSYKYVYDYEPGDENRLENLPLVRESADGGLRPASREEMNDYYQQMSRSFMNARCFARNREYQEYIEANYQIIISEWRSIARINSAEGEIEGFFEGCKTTAQLVDKLLIPTVEEALAGKGSQDFVETFEKQREHFKKHRQLTERIAESQRVDSEVLSYVACFQEFEEARRELLLRQGEGKALFNLALKTRESLDGEAGLLREAQSQMEARFRELERKQASRALAELEADMEKAAGEYSEAQEEFEARREEYALLKRRLENLEMARLKQDLKTARQEADYHQERLQGLDSDPDVRQLESRWDENSAFLRFCYEQEEAVLEQRHSVLARQQQDMERDLQALKDGGREKQAEHQELLGLKGGAQRQLETAQREMKKIAGRLLANPRHDDLSREMSKWEARTLELEKERLAHEEEQRLLLKTRQQVKQEIPALRQNLQRTGHEELNLTQRLERINEEHDRLLQRLKELSPEMYGVDSLYLQQNRVSQAMSDMLEQRRLEKERAHSEDSRAAALYALYEESSFFAPDPRLEDWLEEWQGLFQYLEAGALFVQKAARQASRPEAEFFQNYPFWALSLICPASEVSSLLARAGRLAGELTHPLFVLTQEQARSLVDGSGPSSGDEAWLPAGQVIPSSWRLNLAAANFQEWKQELERSALQARSAFDRREAELRRADECLQQLDDFWQGHPYEDYQQLKAELSHVHENLLVLEQELSKKENRLEEEEARLSQVQKNLEAIREEHSFTSRRIMDGQDYFRREAEREQASRELRQCQELIDNKVRELTVMEKRQERAEQGLQEIRQNLALLQGEMRRLLKEDLYIEVRETPPRFTDLTRERLQWERRDLQDALNQKQKDRRAVEISLNTAKSSIERLQREIGRLQGQCEFAIDEEFIFPGGGDEEIDSLIGRVRLARQARDKSQPRLGQAKEEFDLARDRFRQDEDRFKRRYRERELFNQPLSMVIEALDREARELEEQQRYLDQQAGELAVRRESLARVLAELEKKNERYEFLLDSIPGGDLPPGSIQDFAYQPLKLVARHMESLQESRERVKRQEERLEGERKRLEAFCREELRDVRLKEMVTAGLTQRDSLEKVQEWQKRLSERIARAIRHSQDEIREFDRELQAFINHLHAFLGSVAGELRLIPRKTRVKIEDGWREIFLFDIPEWDEKEGKNELRRHIDWMVRQIESGRFRDDSGNENYALLKSEIGKWLQTRQLLRNVMKEKMIRIKCRKVTADSKVSSYPSSWESSNQWSGGEKWSKNMALFLGLLNYLAEKRQAVDPKARKSRAVLLDNPFGKASSEHVLEPVFFIAQQLGFQIIALTALAEGKFVRDYFPVVYSCRLRPAAGDKFIVSSEKEVRHAYLRDRYPESLRRLGERD